MQPKKVFLVLAALAVLYPLAFLTQPLIRVSQKPAASGETAGRSQAYQELQDQKGYRVFRNSDAEERGLADPYRDGDEAEVLRTSSGSEVNSAGS